MKKMLLLFIALLVVSLCLFNAPAARAGEGYGSHYPGGNEDFMAGALPPAGTDVFINYLVDYDANTLRDNSGNKLTAGPNGPNVSLKLNVLVDAMRYVKVTKVKVFGGDLVWHVIVPVGYQKVALDVGGFGTGPGGTNGSQYKYGLGDIEPGIGIAWHCGPTFHHVAAFDIMMPTGQYNKNDLSNLGRNYWTFNPLWAATYIGDKNSPIPGFEMSSKFMYMFNTINSETSYTSGQEFRMDYLIGQHVGKWAFGINGQFLYQTTSDKQYGNTALDAEGVAGIRARVLSAGPAISYEIPHGCLTFKYQRDLWVENSPEGDKFWLKWIFAF